MINVKISDLLNGTQALQKLAGTELKAKLAWQVGRILKAADEEIQTFNEARLNLIKKYGEKDEKGDLITDDKGNCTVPNTVTKEFSTEMNDLISADVEINANKISIESLDDKEFTPTEMAQLEPFIDFGEDE